MRTSPIELESPLLAGMGGISVLLHQGLISLSWNSVTFCMFHARGVDINIVALVSCGFPD